MKGVVGSIFLRKMCLSLAGVQETGNCLTLSCEVLMYQISHKSIKKFGQFG